MPDFRLHGKTAIITGGAGGLGRSMLAAYAEAGANGPLRAVRHQTRFHYAIKRMRRAESEEQKP